MNDISAGVNTSCLWSFSTPLNYSFAMPTKVVGKWCYRSGEIVIKRRLSGDERRRPNSAEEYRKLASFVATSGAPLGSDYNRWLSKSDTWSRYPGYHRGTSAAEGGATEYSGRRKMSESAVLALIREQSTSRDESENSSSQRGAVQREYAIFLSFHAFCAQSSTFFVLVSEFFVGSSLGRIMQKWPMFVQFNFVQMVMIQILPIYQVVSPKIEFRAAISLRTTLMPFQADRQVSKSSFA